MTDSSSERVTRTGLRVLVRPAGPQDFQILDDLFHHVSQDDLRFRFLTGLKEVSPAQIEAMTHVDHRTAETFIMFTSDSKTPIATAMLASDPKGERGEVAISVHADYRGRGVGWELLSFVAEQAEARGLKVIESVESRANHAAIELEKNMGFTLEEFPDDASLVLVRKTLGAHS